MSTGLDQGGALPAPKHRVPRSRPVVENNSVALCRVQCPPGNCGCSANRPQMALPTPLASPLYLVSRMISTLLGFFLAFWKKYVMGARRFKCLVRQGFILEPPSCCFRLLHENLPLRVHPCHEKEGGRKGRIQGPPPIFFPLLQHGIERGAFASLPISPARPPQSGAQELLSVSFLVTKQTFCPARQLPFSPDSVFFFFFFTSFSLPFSFSLFLLPLLCFSLTFRVCCVCVCVCVITPILPKDKVL
jgi:hypothetical protein